MIAIYISVSKLCLSIAIIMCTTPTTVSINGYEVSTIAFPVFVYKKVPVMCFVAGSFDKPISGAQIEEIAARMQASADRVTDLASGKEKLT